MNGITFQTASQVAAAIRDGQTSAVEVVEGLLARIEQYNPALNAIITLEADVARHQARQADEALRRGEPCGSLHGVPITIKDSFETAGMRTVSGFLPFTNHVPQVDAPPVTRLRQAGAILLGKTNLPTLASGIQTNNPVFGRTNNPWDLERTPGGSSGGAAAAVSAGLTCLDLGSDIGGSIRIPAHFCGIYGLKATGGRISGKGHLSSPKQLVVPSGWEALLQMGSFGPLARSVADLRLCFPIVAEPGTPNLEPGAALPPSDLRIAWTDDFGGTPLDADTKRLMQHLADDLKSAGCRVKKQNNPGFDYAEAWYVSGSCLGCINTLFQPRALQLLRRAISPLVSLLGGKNALLKGVYAGATLKPGMIQDILARRAEIIEAFERFLSSWDAWIVPVFPCPAFTHRSKSAPIEVGDQKMPQLMANLLHSVIFNMTGSPVVTIPIGFSSQGLPVGVQVVGRRWQELDLLNVAEQIAKQTVGYQPPPAYAPAGR
jgi:amidase